VPQPGEVMVGGRSRALTTSVLALLGLVALLVLVGRLADGSEHATQTASGPGREQAEAVAARFFAAWSAEDWAGLQELIADQSLDAASVHAEAHRVLRVTETTVTADAPAPLEETTDRIVVPFEVRWELDGLPDVSHRGELPLVSTAEGWRVRWWYPVVHPDLTPERRFERVRSFRQRAPILAADGAPLVTSRPEVAVGVDPGRVLSPADVAAALAAHAGAAAGADAGVDAATMEAEIEAAITAGGEGFHPLVTLDIDAFEAARGELDSLAGVISHRRSARVLHGPAALTSLVGGVGEVTEELLGELGTPYRSGDAVGRSGLERTHERRLAGEPQQEARIVDGSGLVTTLVFVDGAAPEPVQLTIDAALQEAAAAALEAVAQPAALVAVDTATGEIRAAVSTPHGEFARALEGRYPPGSTFKIVTAAAALTRGRLPADRVDCPPELVVVGRPLRNAGGDGPGEISFSEAMARSCNTAFAQLGLESGADGLADAAASFGFDVDYDVGLPAAGGSFPPPADDAELAAAAIGQGRVTASPLHMASVAAAAATGTWRAPRLLQEPEVAHEREEAAELRLPEGIRPSLAQLLRAAVADGTGRAANLPGAPVHGKTGSAEFGTGPQLATHAWFVGWRGELAFAVLVEGGGGGGAVAAPVAAAFLDAAAITDAAGG
jgi:cell division protein FtsI/penicillin-binding protein 2